MTPRFAFMAPEKACELSCNWASFAPEWASMSLEWHSKAPKWVFKALGWAYMVSKWASKASGWLAVEISYSFSILLTYDDICMLIYIVNNKFFSQRSLLGQNVCCLGRISKFCTNFDNRNNTVVFSGRLFFLSKSRIPFEFESSKRVVTHKCEKAIK